MAMGLFYGGLAQLIAGILAYHKENMFAAIAFISYSLFWISLVAVLLLPGTGLTPGPSANSLGFYMLVWAVFSTVMCAGTFKFAPHSLKVVFITVSLLFYLLAIHFFTGNMKVQYAAGGVGIFCGASAMYTAFGEILNEIYNRSIIPLGMPK
jgi:succinate-acetate transporter protein